MKSLSAQDLVPEKSTESWKTIFKIKNVGKKEESNKTKKILLPSKRIMALKRISSAILHSLKSSSIAMAVTLTNQ